MKKNKKKIILVALLAFFAIGAVSGSYNCTGGLETAVGGTANFAVSVVKATLHGVTQTLNTIWGVFA